MKNTNFGTLYLIPNTLGENNSTDVLPISVKTLIDRIDTYIVENQKAARRFIKHISPDKHQSSLNLFEINKHNPEEDISIFLTPCKEGIDIGLISDAGCPGIADPGANIIRFAHDQNIRVKPLVGPSSILLAMMSSGMNGQRFAFNGYLPIDKSDRKKELKRLEKLSLDHNQSQLFIETPYRNNKLLEDICSTLNDATDLCIACDITLPTEYIKTKPIKLWKKNSADLNKRPALFIINNSKKII